jgi:hypothetical protein
VVRQRFVEEQLQILRFAQADKFFFAGSSTDFHPYVWAAGPQDSPDEQEGQMKSFIDYVSKLASASRKSRVSELAAVHSSRNTPR